MSHDALNCPDCGAVGPLTALRPTGVTEFVTILCRSCRRAWLVPVEKRKPVTVNQPKRPREGKE